MTCIFESRTLLRSKPLSKWRVDGDRAKFLETLGNINTEYAMGLRDKIAARPLNESTAALNELEQIREQNGGPYPHGYSTLIP